jgi:hypothetical protein
MKKKALNILLLLALTSSSFSQTGGDNVYEFLNLTHSGLVSSLGGSNVSLSKIDLNLAYHNPALLNHGMQKSMALNYANYIAGINYGMAMYSPSFKKRGTFAAGLTYLNYGTFTESDASGNITGDFGASEYAFLGTWSRNIDSLFSVGINVKPVLSHLESYTSFGIAFDFGAAYHNQSNLFSAGLVIKNAGLQITSYAGEPKQNLPFEIQAGLSQRLAHAPLRFSLTLRHLEKFDLTNEYSASTDDDSESNSSDFFENVLRHMVMGAELIPHKNVYFSAGYNYQRRSELKVDAKGSAVGFSWGFGIKTSWLDLSFGRATYHLAGASNHVSIVVRHDKIYKKQNN